ncbi:hypothetical protein H2200_004036 [Cladophialophora chaetospira]|uniref:Uncharacterized protein n=1 Tax=Cladophialophora chaetospira TaxID=386627 RepID=A0AA39CKI6_9EURO|nr:hypothetical protein H2200_004036 [Cladophialophora chaetospira]
MQIAAFLSDLKSLSICSNEAALALVKPEPANDSQSPEELQSRQSPSSATQAQADEDLRRADELVSLHYDVKLKYVENGPDPELVKAGRDVDEVVAILSRSQ